jgi:hypothetical protein
MDDFRVGSIPSYDPLDRQHPDDSSGRRKRKHPDPQGAEEDVVTLNEPAPEDEEAGTGYGPHRGGD